MDLPAEKSEELQIIKEKIIKIDNIFLLVGEKSRLNNVLETKYKKLLKENCNISKKLEEVMGEFEDFKKKADMDNTNLEDQLFGERLTNVELQNNLKAERKNITKLKAQCRKKQRKQRENCKKFIHKNNIQTKFKQKVEADKLNNIIKALRRKLNKKAKKTETIKVVNYELIEDKIECLEIKNETNHIELEAVNEMVGSQENHLEELDDYILKQIEEIIRMPKLISPFPMEIETTNSGTQTSQTMVNRSIQINAKMKDSSTQTKRFGTNENVSEIGTQTNAEFSNQETQTKAFTETKSCKITLKKAIDFLKATKISVYIKNGTLLLYSKKPCSADIDQLSSNLLFKKLRHYIDENCVRLNTLDKKTTLNKFLAMNSKQMRRDQRRFKALNRRRLSEVRQEVLVSDSESSGYESRIDSISESIPSTIENFNVGNIFHEMINENDLLLPMESNDYIEKTNVENTTVERVANNKTVMTRSSILDRLRKRIKNGCPSKIKQRKADLINETNIAEQKRLLSARKAETEALNKENNLKSQQKSEQIQNSNETIIENCLASSRKRKLPVKCKTNSSVVESKELHTPETVLRRSPRRNKINLLEIKQIEVRLEKCTENEATQEKSSPNLETEVEGSVLATKENNIEDHTEKSINDGISPLDRPVDSLQENESFNLDTTNFDDNFNEEIRSPRRGKLQEEEPKSTFNKSGLINLKVPDVMLETNEQENNQQQRIIVTRSKSNANECPIEKPKKKLTFGKAKLCLERIVNARGDADVLQGNLSAMRTEESATLAKYLIQYVLLDKSEPEKPDQSHEPFMTITQKVVLGVMRMLEKDAHPDLVANAMTYAENCLIFNGGDKGAEECNNLARFYVALARTRSAKSRIRVFIMDLLFFKARNRFAIIFQTLTNWMAVLDVKKPDCNCGPFESVLNYAVQMENSQEDSLGVLKNVLVHYFRYEAQVAGDQLMKELLEMFISKEQMEICEMCVLILMRHNSAEWICKQIGFVAELAAVVIDAEVAKALVAIIGKVKKYLPQEKVAFVNEVGQLLIKKLKYCDLEIAEYFT